MSASGLAGAAEATVCLTAAHDNREQAVARAHHARRQCQRVRGGHWASAPTAPTVCVVHLVAHLVHADRGCGAVRGAGIYWISPVKHSRPVFGAMRPLHPPGRPQRGSGAAESMRSWLAGGRGGALTTLATESGVQDLLS